MFLVFVQLRSFSNFFNHAQEEYWAAVAKNFFESQELAEFDCIDDDSDKLINLIELWTAVGLYMKTDHVLLSDLPDTDIK